MFSSSFLEYLFIHAAKVYKSICFWKAGNESFPNLQEFLKNSLWLPRTSCFDACDTMPTKVHNQE